VTDLIKLRFRPKSFRTNFCPSITDKVCAKVISEK
jgi:hypothetical protein